MSGGLPFEKVCKLPDFDGGATLEHAVETYRAKLEVEVLEHAQTLARAEAAEATLARLREALSAWTATAPVSTNAPTSLFVQTVRAALEDAP